MASADSGLAGVLDFGGASTETTATPTDITVDTVTETTQTPNTETTNEPQDSTTPRTQDGKTQPITDPDLKFSETTPQNVRAALKAWKESDASPEHHGLVKSLHLAYERAVAYDKVFDGGVRGAKELSAFLSGAVGLSAGQKPTLQAVKDHWASLKAFQNNVTESDQALYNGDPQVIDNIVADLKEQGHLDALGKLANPFIRALQENSPESYSRFASGLIASELRASNFVQTFNEIFKSAKAEGATSTLEGLKSVARWFAQLEQVSDAAKRDPLAEERKQFEAQKKAHADSVTKQFQTEVAGEADKGDNRSLGSALKTYLKTPFFKDFPRETLVDLASSIKSELQKRLNGDKVYQMQMKAHWSAKTPDKSAILTFHNSKVESIAEEVVRSVVQRRYPQYSRGASAAAGRQAAAQTKAAATVATGAGSSKTNPVFVAVKPDRKSIDWSVTTDMDLIGGKAKVGSRWVTWRKPYQPEVRGGK